MTDPVFRRRLLRVCLITLGLGLAAVLFFCLARMGIGIGCPVYQLTGLQCPGCGNSRAAMALLRLDFAAAFSYNPTFPLQFGYLGWVYLSCCVGYLKGKRFTYAPPLPALDIVLLVIFVLWGILRNLI